jgi:hypothetical protein
MTRILFLPMLALALGASTALAADEKDYSPAEKLLFMTDQLGALRLPTTLQYSFRKAGSMEEAFDDKVAVAIGAGADGKCCTGRGEFLTGARKLPMPDIDGATGNPVLMYFLEREVREMQRLTKGSQSHFRKQLRMAIYRSAQVRELPLSYRGKEVKGREVLISPYLDDPNRPKYEKLAIKEYRFWLSDAVPGAVFGIRTRVAGAAADAAPLLVEELLAEGATAPAAAPNR